ncbi:hypothetical protein [Brevundimonas sp.]|uniref:hypothetical protein n=1 Tax=Brevundimonas sp. TaxID=1871086 RepID=UPI003D146D81
MSISMVSSFLNAALMAGGTDATRQKSPSVSPARSEIDEIREKGMVAWAHDKKIEELKKRIEDEILAQRGLTKEGVAALPEADRTTVENEIARLIEDRLQETLQAQAEEAAQGGKTEGVLLNIMV